MANDWDVTVVRGSEAAARAIDFAPADVVSTPFQHPEWLKVWAQSFADGDTARVFLVVAREKPGGRVVLRLPLGLEIHSSVRVLRGWDRGTADYGGPILDRDFALSPADFRRLWARIEAVLPPCDVVALDKMPLRLGEIDNPLLGLAGVERSFNSAHVLRLAAEGTATAETFDGTMRRSLARKRRKLEHKGVLAFRFGPAASGLEALEALEAWRRARFADENRGHDVASVEAFWRRLASEAEIARIAELRLDGRLLAAGFGTRTGSSFQLLATAFDAQWKNWSPGLLLVEDLIGAAEADGVRLFDFTIGEEAYKLAFHVEAPPLFDLFRPRTLKGFAAAWYRRLQIRRRRRRLAGERSSLAPPAPAPAEVD